MAGKSPSTDESDFVPLPDVLQGVQRRFSLDAWAGQDRIRDAYHIGDLDPVARRPDGTIAALDRGYFQPDPLDYGETWREMFIDGIVEIGFRARGSRRPGPVERCRVGATRESLDRFLGVGEPVQSAPEPPPPGARPAEPAVVNPPPPARKRRTREQPSRPYVVAAFRKLYGSDEAPPRSEVSDHKLHAAVNRQIKDTIIQGLGTRDLTDDEQDAAVRERLKADRVAWPISESTVLRAAGRRVDKSRSRK
jgi:hypothetical protein